MIVDIKQVKTNPKNPRVIKDDKFKKLVKSIQEFPDMLNKRPLVCFTDTDGTYYFNEEYEVKEDYELTLRNIKDGRPTVRTNILFMQHEHTQTKGGCRDSKRIDKEKKALKMLLKEYPGMIKQAKHRGTDFSIQLNL